MSDYNYRIIKLGNGKGTALVDKEDYENISKHNWSIGRGYAKRNILPAERKSNTNKSALMHRHIIDCPVGFEIDHINGLGLDNRKSNLRICIHSDNHRNCIARKNSKSGTKGVTWRESQGKWNATIQDKGKKHHLGSFDTKEEALHARKNAEDRFNWTPVTSNYKTKYIKPL